MQEQDALISAIAMAMYMHHVPSMERARRIDEALNGTCMDNLPTLVKDMKWGLKMTLPAASTYMRQAMDAYGHDAELHLQDWMPF